MEEGQFINYPVHGYLPGSLSPFLSLSVSIAMSMTTSLSTATAT